MTQWGHDPESIYFGDPARRKFMYAAVEAYMTEKKIEMEANRDKYESARNRSPETHAPSPRNRPKVRARGIRRM